MATTTTSEEFKKAPDYQFKEEDIERAKALVGRWAPSGAREFLTTATPDAIEEGVTAALEYTEHAIRGLREIISDLRPAALDAGVQRRRGSGPRSAARARHGLYLLEDRPGLRGRPVRRGLAPRRLRRLSSSAGSREPAD